MRDIFIREICLDRQILFKRQCLPSDIPQDAWFSVQIFLRLPTLAWFSSRCQTRLQDRLPEKCHGGTNQTKFCVGFLAWSAMSKLSSETKVCYFESWFFFSLESAHAVTASLIRRAIFTSWSPAIRSLVRTFDIFGTHVGARDSKTPRVLPQEPEVDFSFKFLHFDWFIAKILESWSV